MSNFIGTSEGMELAGATEIFQHSQAIW